MIKRPLCVVFLSIYSTIPIRACAFASNQDGGIVTNWQIFRDTVEYYKKSIKSQKNIENSAQAEKRGKKLFLEGRYDQAYLHGYGDAIAWIPRPEYYFIVGDINLRMKLSLHSDSPYATPEYKACWDKYLFQADVNRELVSSFEMGFGLVGELNLSKTRNSRIYKQAMANAACFARLTSKYTEGVGPQCVPVEEVRACLGSPLLFLHH
jgi:hypothetical protein